MNKEELVNIYNAICDNLADLDMVKTDNEADWSLLFQAKDCIEKALIYIDKVINESRI